ncbi:MAG: metal ABC transporter ATP-binding protein, partial [Actinobacteria bacterium]|nr:metal ABC transporter ATP-binding protein [Actinomycetota bacterium]
GSVRLFGADPRELRERWRVGYVPQRLGVDADLPATVREVVAAGRLARTGWLGRFRAPDRQAIDRALEAVALTDLQRARLGELSGGQQQRVFIAKALAGEPELLVLDEPVAGVDADSQRRFRDSLMSLLRDRHGAVLLVSHELASVADDLDRVVVLKRSVVFQGPPADLVASGVSLGVHRQDLPIWLEGLEP